MKPFFDKDPSHYKRFAAALEAMPEANVWELSANIERNRYKCPRREW
jgi:hypothetical protein